MANEHLSELLRNANPVTREPTRPMDAAWDEIVIGHQSVRMSTARPRKHATSMWTHPRRLLTIAAAVVLIVGVSTFVSIQGSGNPSSLSSDFAHAFGVVNANAATAGGFSTVPATPQGSRRLTCPTSEVCYLESDNIALNGSDVTTVYKTTDGGTDWSSLSLPSAGSANTELSCSSVSVCSVGYVESPATSPAGFYQGTVQSMLSTTDGGTKWTKVVVAIDPAKGDDAALDGSLVNVQGQWSQLQCFSATSCVAVALVPSDQPQEPVSNVDPEGVMRTVIMRTDDGGATWNSAVLPWSSAVDGSPGWSNAQLTQLACATATDCIGLSTVFRSIVNNVESSNVKVWQSSDGGVTWQSAWAPAPAIMSSIRGGLTCPTTLHCYAVVQAGSAFPGKPEIMTTSDGGQTWAFDNPVAPSSGGSDVRLLSVSCSTESTCWTAGEERLSGTNSWQAAMWATSDSGGTWTSIPLPSGLGIIFQVVCNAPASCLAVAQPPYSSGQAAPQGPLPGEILSNQN
jgi:photosystem II stability/assembly factor-like uncharacterized protein